MSWAHYFLQVNIYLVIFYSFYKLLLDKETYFLLNRIYLLSAGVLSFAIPFLRFEFFQPVAKPIYTGAVELNDLMTQVTMAPDSTEQFNWGSLVVFLYVTGVVLLSVRFMWQLLGIRKLLAKVQTGMAFSFFRKKLVDSTLPQAETIDRHEEIHIRQLHTVDVLFFEVISIFTWFNPITYFYKNTIKNIHEYLADEEAAKFQGDKEQYALLLLSTALGVAPNSLINTFFNKSLLKKRIFMLHKQRSRKTAILKYGLFLPLFAITLTMSSATISNNEKIRAASAEIPLDAPLEVVKEVIANPINIAISGQTKADVKMPEKTREDWESFYDFIRKTIKYPAEARKAGITGNSQVRFSLKGGEIENISTVNKIGGGCEAELMRTVLSYKNFKPSQNGDYTLSVIFSLENASGPAVDKVSIKVNGYTSLQDVIVVGYGNSTARLQEVEAIPRKGISINEKDTTGKGRTIIRFNNEKLSNEPLYIVDGEPVEGLDMLTLSADKIESISVLKDGNAVTLHGPKGKNGVIVITTKAAAAKEQKKTEVKKEN